MRQLQSKIKIVPLPGFLLGAALMFGLGMTQLSAAAHQQLKSSDSQPGMACSDYNDRLIREISQKSSLVFAKCKNNEMCWNTGELETFKEVLDLLPPEYKSLKTIRVKKKFHASGVSLSRREIYIDASCPGVDRNRLKTSLVRYLTQFLDHDKRISDRDDWRRISRWTGWDLLGNKSENKNPKGFALPEGRKSPAEDFVTAVQLFFVTPYYRDPAEYLKYRLPCKYRFIQNLFACRPDPQKDIICPTTYKDWIDPGDVEQIELLIASPSYASVASIAGHLSLLIRRKNDIRGLSTVVSFVADTTGTVENGFSYMIKGVFGKFDSLIQEETLYDVIQRQTIRENRDIYRLKIKFTREQVDTLIQRIWEIKHTFTYRYYFFNKNCTTMLLNLINDALGKNQRVKDRSSIDLPLNIGSALFRSGVAEFVYPEYWSISRQARYNSQKNDLIKEEIIAYFYRHVDAGKAEEMAGYFRKAGDEKETHRTLYYQKLLALYFDCFGRYIDFSLAPDQPDRRREYYLKGKLLLNYFMNAKERENYLAITSISAKTLNSHENINLYEFPGTAALIASALKLRHFLSAAIMDEVAAIHGEMENELNRYVVEQRRKRTYSCGYSPVVFTAGYNVSNNRAYFVPSLKLSTFFQHLGDNSVFSLGQDTYLELLSVEAILGTDLEHGPVPGAPGAQEKTFFDKSFKLLEFKKIIKKNTPDYTGRGNKGFGLTLYDTYSDKTMKIGKDVTVFNFRYIFNIFETDSFRNYVNFEWGPGYSYITNLKKGKRKFLDVFFEFNGQFHPFSYKFHTFRFWVTCRPRLNFRFCPLTTLKAGIEADWIFSARSNTVLTTGISYESNILQHRFKEVEDFSGSRMSVYISYRINSKWLPGWGDIKNLLNKIF